MNFVAAPSTPQVCWMLTRVRLKADAIVKSPDCMEKHGEMRFLWKGEGAEDKEEFGSWKESKCLPKQFHV